MPFNLGMTEMIVILLIVLLVFGAKRLPEMGSSLGKGIQEFKKSLKEVQSSIEDDTEKTPPARRLDSAPKEGGEPKKLSE